MRHDLAGTSIVGELLSYVRNLLSSYEKGRVSELSKEGSRYNTAWLGLHIYSSDPYPVIIIRREGNSKDVLN